MKTIKRLLWLILIVLVIVASVQIQGGYDKYQQALADRPLTDVLEELQGKGDFVISMRSFQGGLEYSENTGSISSAYVMLIPNLDYVVPEYYKWALKSPTYITALQSTSNLVREGQAMRYTNFVQVPLCIIPKEEQERIADKLNGECKKIDTLIINQQNQIEKLKQYKQSLITEVVTKGLNSDVEMKDSGIKAWGNISENANLIQIRYVAKLNGRIGFRGYTQNDLVLEGEGAITLSPSNMKEMKMVYDKCAYLSWEKYEESPEIKIHNGDVLFVKTGSTYGKCSYVDNLPIEELNQYKKSIIYEYVTGKKEA